MKRTVGGGGNYTFPWRTIKQRYMPIASCSARLKAARLTIMASLHTITNGTEYLLSISRSFTTLQLKSKNLT